MWNKFSVGAAKSSSSFDEQQFVYTFTPGLRSPLQEALTQNATPSARIRVDRDRVTIIDDKTIVAMRGYNRVRQSQEAPTLVRMQAEPYTIVIQVSENNTVTAYWLDDHHNNILSLSHVASDISDIIELLPGLDKDSDNFDLIQRIKSKYTSTLQDASNEIIFHATVTPELQAIYAELDQYYLDTQKGICSAAQGLGQSPVFMGDKLFLTSRESDNSFAVGQPIGRVVAEISTKDANSVRILSTNIFTQAKYLNTYLLPEFESRPALFSPVSNTIPVEDFLSTKLEVAFTHVYIKRSGDRPDVYEFSRRLDNYVLASASLEGIDMIAELDLIKLDKLYENFVKKLETFSTALVDDIETCVTNYSGLDHSSARHTGSVIVESSTIKLSQRMLQYSIKLVQNIRADLSLRKTRLKIILVLLGNPSLVMWQDERNKKGLLVTLLYHLDFPLTAEREQASNADIQHIKGALQAIELFDFSRLKEIVVSLQGQVTEKTKELERFSRMAQSNFSDDIFQTTRKQLSQTSLSSQLEALARNTQNKSLEVLAKTCRAELSGHDEELLETQGQVPQYDETESMCSPIGSFDLGSFGAESGSASPMRESIISAYSSEKASNFDGVPTLAGRQRQVFYAALLKQYKNNGFPQIIKQIMSILLRLSKPRKAYRKNFLAPLDRIEEKSPLGPYIKYTVEKILIPLENMKSMLEKVDLLNAYYAVLSIYKRNNWDVAFQTQIKCITDSIEENTYTKDDIFPFYSFELAAFQNLQSSFAEFRRDFESCKLTCTQIITLLEKIEGESEILPDGKKHEVAKAYIKAYWVEVLQKIEEIPVKQKEVVLAACPDCNISRFIIKQEEPSDLKDFIIAFLSWINSFINLFDKIIELKGGYKLLRCDADKMRLMQALQGKIEEPAWEKLDFRSIQEKLLGLIIGNQKILYETLDKTNSFASETLSLIIKSLYVGISKQEELSTPSTALALSQYFENQYQRSYRLSQGCISAFDEVSSDYLKNIAGSNVSLFKLALFFRHLYGGMLFANYIAENPFVGQNSFRMLFYKNLFKVVCNAGLNDTNYIDTLVGKINRVIKNDKNYINDLEASLYQYEILKRLSSDADVPESIPSNTIFLRGMSGGGVTAYWVENDVRREVYKTDFYFDFAKLENNQPINSADIKAIRDNFGCPPLLNMELRLLGNDWATFIALCVWMSALANTSLFSPEQVFYIHRNISTLLFKNTWERSNFLDQESLKEMQDVWRFYLSCAIGSQYAAQEYMQTNKNYGVKALQKYVSLAELESSKKSSAPPASALEMLRNIGDALYVAASEYNFLKKTIWLNAALDFYSKIKHVLKSNVLDEGEVEKNNKIMIRILELILGSANVPLQKKNEILDLVTNLFADEKMREYSLNSVLEQCSWTESIESRDYIIESRVPAIIFSNSHIKLFSEDDFVETAQAELSTGKLEISVFLNKLYAGLNGVLKLIEKTEYHLFIPCLMKPLLTAFSIIMDQSPGSITEGALDVWQQCVNLLKNIIRISGHYASSLNAFADALQVVSLKESINFYYAVCLYIGFARLQKAHFKIEAATEIASGFLKKHASYKINLSEAEALRYIVKPSQIFSKNLSEQQQRLVDFIKISVNEIKRFDDVLAIKAANMPKNFLSYSSVLSVDSAALILKEIYEMHLQNWHNPQSGSSMPMNYPVVFIYQPDSKKAEFKCIEIYEKCHQDNVIVKHDCGINASYLLARAARFVSEAEEGSPYNDDSIEKILCCLKNQPKTDNTVLQLRFNNCVLSLVREAMQAIRECYVGIRPITKAFLSSGNMYDDPRILLCCSPDTLIGFCIIACLCRHLREKRDVAYSNVADLLDYLEDFFSTRNNVTVLGGSQGVAKSQILTCVPAHLKRSDLLKIDSELLFGVDQVKSEDRQEACIRWWFNSSPRENEASSESSAKARLKL